MTDKSSNRKRVLIIVGIILAVILVVAIVVAVRSAMQNVKALAPSRLRDQAWELVTPLVDQGGAALMTQGNGKGYLVLSRSDGSGMDLRDGYVKISDKREDGQRVMYIDIDPAETALGERGYEAPHEYHKPVAVYEFKLRDADRIELRVEGQEQAFTQMIEVQEGAVR